jgi:hypothetical protein
MLAGSWEGSGGTGGHRGSWRCRVRCRIDHYDAWKEASGGGWGRRGRKAHARNRSNNHTTGIRGDDDGIKFGERRARWGSDSSEVQLVRDHIAYDLAHG